MIDKAILITIILRIWAALSAILTIYLTALYFSNTDLGIFYSLYSIIMLVQFFDFGLNIRTTQVISSTMINLKSQTPSLSEIELSLERYKIKLYWLFYVIVLTILFYNTNTIRLQDSEKLITYLSMIVISYFSLNSNLSLAAIEGLGLVYKSSLIKLSGMIFGSIILWVAIYFKIGYNSILFSTVPVSLYLWVVTKNINFKKIKSYDRKKIKWFEIEQIQLTITNLCSYGTLHFPTLILSQNNFLTSAGKAGITFQLIGAITGFAITPHNARIYKYCNMYNVGDFNGHLKLHNKTSFFSWILIVILISSMFFAYQFGVDPIVEIFERSDIPNQLVPVGLIIFCLHYFNKESVFIQSAGGDGASAISLSRMLAIILIVNFGFMFLNMSASSIIYVSYTFVFVVSIIAIKIKVKKYEY